MPLCLATSTARPTTSQILLFRPTREIMFACLFIFLRALASPPLATISLFKPPKLNFLINAICNGIVKWSEARMICHCTQRGEWVSLFGNCWDVFTFFCFPSLTLRSSPLKKGKRQKFTTNWTMRKMLSSALVWVNVTFNRLFTAVTMNGWVLLKGFLFLLVVKFESNGRKHVCVEHKVRAKVHRAS